MAFCAIAILICPIAICPTQLKQLKYISLKSTNLPPVPHKCVSGSVSIGSDNGLSPIRRQAIIWTKANPNPTYEPQHTVKDLPDTTMIAWKEIWYRNSYEMIRISYSTVILKPIDTLMFRSYYRGGTAALIYWPPFIRLAERTLLCQQSNSFF